MCGVAYGIPNLQFDVILFDFEHFGPELHPDGDFMFFTIPLVSILEQHARFANS